MKNAVPPELEIVSGSGHHQLAMLDPLDADQFMGDLFDLADGGTDDQHFQTVMGVEMDVQGRDDFRMV